MFRLTRKRRGMPHPKPAKTDEQHPVDNSNSKKSKAPPVPVPEIIKHQTSSESESEDDFMQFPSTTTDEDDSNSDNEHTNNEDLNSNNDYEIGKYGKYKTPIASIPPSPNPDSTPTEPLLLVDMPLRTKWHQFSIRFTMSLLMLLIFSLIILSGHLSVILMVVIVQIGVFRECIAVAHVPTKEKKLPWFRAINWYFLFTACYYLYGDLLLGHYYQSDYGERPFDISSSSASFVDGLAQNHRFISFSMYLCGFIMFVLNLKRGHYKFQFLQFFWTHMTLLLVIAQSHFIISSILEGLVWFLVPVSLVICNDICAYLGGFFFGRLRLTELSPKKTIEGFVLGGVGTVILGVILAHFVVQVPYLLCPASRDLLTSSYWSFGGYPASCAPSAMQTISALTKEHTLTLPGQYVIKWTSMQAHALVMAVFASMIAPFGGFFASGFKRAFKLKDFGDSIPGHGGLTDRMDCQFMMGCFSYIYYMTFVKVATATTLTSSAAAAVGSASSSAAALSAIFGGTMSARNAMAGGPVAGVHEVFEAITKLLDTEKQVELYRLLGNYLSSIN